MTASTSVVRASIELALEPAAAFDILIAELAMALDNQGILFEPGEHGRIVQGTFEVGRVVSWKPGEVISLRWQQASWEPKELTEVELQFEQIGGGTRITLEHRGWGGLLDNSDEITGWFAEKVAAPLLLATSGIALGDWITDRRARRPSGAQARSIYRSPLYHYPNFRVILSELALTSKDYLLEVGCGGGAFLKDAMKSGCRAAAVDHSPDMVRLAREVNHDAVASSQLEILEADAHHLPFSNAQFTCATMTGVLGFLKHPVTVLAEIHRVLIDGGRVVLLGSDPELRGTPAAPEPMASRLQFYTEDELLHLALSAGFGTARVVRRGMEQFAREVGVPEEHLPLFAGPGATFLLARKD